MALRLRRRSRPAETARGSGAPTTEAAARSRRRFSRRRWSGRVSRLRWVVSAVAVLAVAAGIVWAVYFSSLLTVRRVAVDDPAVAGGNLLATAQILRTAQVPMGVPVARVDTQAICDRLAKLAAVSHVTVSRSWPHAVHIQITERTAVAAVQRAGTWSGVDASGVVFRTYPQAPARLPHLVAGAHAGRSALREAARVIASLPASVMHKVTSVDVGSIDKISLHLRHGRQVEWGSADQAPQKAEVLAILLKRHAQRIDVSVPGRPTTG